MGIGVTGDFMTFCYYVFYKVCVGLNFEVLRDKKEGCPDVETGEKSEKIFYAGLEFSERIAVFS
jgi:hypothetical protein